MRIRDKIDKEFKEKGLPEPRKPKKDGSQLFDILEGISNLADPDVVSYQAQLNAWFNYYIYQTVKKKHEIIELEDEYNELLYKEMDLIDSKLYKTVGERTAKALEQNDSLKGLKKELNLQKEKHRRLESLEKIFDKTLYTVSREITRRIEIIRGRDGNYGHN